MVILFLSPWTSQTSISAPLYFLSLNLGITQFCLSYVSAIKHKLGALKKSTSLTDYSHLFIKCRSLAWHSSLEHLYIARYQSIYCWTPIKDSHPCSHKPNATGQCKSGIPFSLLEQLLHGHNTYCVLYILYAHIQSRMKQKVLKHQ